MPKKIVSYEDFCSGVENALEPMNEHLNFDGRYIIAQLEEAGFYHVLLCRPAGEPRPVFELAGGLKEAFFPDMTETEFMALSADFVSGKTEFEDFDAVPIYVLYEAFCERP